MITKIQSNQNQQQTFTAKWPDVRKVIQNMPEDHHFFCITDYTLNGKTAATKEVVLARLDKFADVMKNELKQKITLPLDLPNFSTLFTNPKKFFQVFAAKDRMIYGEKPFNKGHEYPFKRVTIERDNGAKVLTEYETDSTGEVAGSLLFRGHDLAKELKKAGLENPKEIVF